LSKYDIKICINIKKQKDTYMNDVKIDSSECCCREVWEEHKYSDVFYAVLKYLDIPVAQVPLIK